MKRVEYLVDWPVQGALRLRTPEMELVLSDIFAHVWLFVELGRAAEKRGSQPDLIRVWEEGFRDRLIEHACVTAETVELALMIKADSAPAFRRLRTPSGVPLPSPVEVLGSFVEVLTVAESHGSVELECM